MPRISAFYGIAIWMYWDEGAHARPHFHARYGRVSGVDRLRGEVVVGWLPPRALGFVSEWALLHAGELQANWDRARDSQPLLPIEQHELHDSIAPLVDVVAVEVIGDHRLRLSFEDGTVGDIAFDDREWRGVFEPLADCAFFAQVRVDPESGTIVWPNGVDMAPERCTPRRDFTASRSDPRADSVAEPQMGESYYGATVTSRTSVSGPRMDRCVRRSSRGACGTSTSRPVFSSASKSGWHRTCSPRSSPLHSRAWTEAGPGSSASRPDLRAAARPRCRSGRHRARRARSR